METVLVDPAMVAARAKEAGLEQPEQETIRISEINDIIIIFEIIEVIKRLFLN